MLVAGSNECSSQRNATSHRTFALARLVGIPETPSVTLVLIQRSSTAYAHQPQLPPPAAQHLKLGLSIFYYA